MPTTDPPALTRVVVLGGGFAGVETVRELPRFEKKPRAAIDWTLDLLFSKNLVQFATHRAPGLVRNLVVEPV